MPSLAAIKLDRKLEELRRLPRRRVAASTIFPSNEAKGGYLDGAAREDAQRPEIRALAACVISLPYGHRAEELFAFVRRSIRYRVDESGEELEDAVTSLVAGEDDCDGSARALAALALAAGLEARVRSVVSEDLQHIEHFQSELRWPGSSAHPRALPSGWVLAETTLAGVLLGQGSEAGEELPNGDYRVVGRE
jgi:transglutaminase-like putative cysteine protease